MARVLVITGDGGESYEALYAPQGRFGRRAGGSAVRVAAPTRRRLHLVMHDFEPESDSSHRKRGLWARSRSGIGSGWRAEDYDAALILSAAGRPRTCGTMSSCWISCHGLSNRAEKWIFAICHGIQVLAAAGLIAVDV